MRVQSWDAAVIGGGPAGSSAAISLARRGLEIVLLEKSTYPHDKVCGEFLSPECLNTLEALASEELPLFNRAVAIRTFRLSSMDGNVWKGQFPSQALSISRSELDNELQWQAQLAGVKVRQATKVTGVEGDLSSGFHLHLRDDQGKGLLHARAVIGAYGKRSRIDFEQGRAFIQRDQEFIALKAHFYGPSLDDQIELHAFPGGYCGLSNIEDGKRNACLLVRQSVFRAANREGQHPVEAFIDWMCAQNPALYSWFHQAKRIHDRWMVIAQIPFQSKEIILNDMLMAGDAAGVIAPLAGDGIAMALDSGILAGEMLSQYLQGRISKMDLLVEYPRRWKQAFRQRLWLGRILQSLLLRPGPTGWILRLLSAVPELGTFIIARTRGEIDQTR